MLKVEDENKVDNFRMGVTGISSDVLKIENYRQILKNINELKKQKYYKQVKGIDIYNVGRDELDENYELSKLLNLGLEWFVYAYEHESYDGSGSAVGFNPVLKIIYVWYLGHCSCFGPLDENFSGSELRAPHEVYTLEQWKQAKTSIFGPDIDKNISELVETLLLKWK